MSKPSFKEQFLFKIYSWFKIPLIGFCSPTVVQNDAQKIVLKIPLTKRTKNHLNSMYFGALSVGADVCVGLLAMNKIEEHKAKTGERIDFVFKDFKAQFLKRAEGDVHFICDDTTKVSELIETCKTSTERHEGVIPAYAIVPSVSEEKVASFELTISIKRRLKK